MINNVAKQRNLYSLRIVSIAVVMTAVAWLIMDMCHVDNIYGPLAVSVGFSVIVNLTDVLIWSRIAKQCPDYLPIFYTSSSGFRMLLALMVMLVYYLVTESGGMLPFFAVFMSYYFVFLINHVVFFTHVSRKQMTT